MNTKDKNLTQDEQDRLEWLTEIDKKIEAKKQAYQGQHCCLVMEARLENPLEFMMYYDPIFRAYSIDNQHYAKFYLDYCPACGKKLPSRLRDRWVETIQNELNIDLPFDMDRRRLPKEFKSDAWWKKRGL